MKKEQIKLTRKQREVTELLACDYNIPEAAVKLGVARRSLEERVARTWKRLKVKYVQGLVAEAIRQSLIDIQQLKKRKRN